MRLSDDEIKVIKAAAARHFGTRVHVGLFGSRVDDNKRGGDIDLYVDTKLANAAAAVRAEMNFWSELQFRLGEQRIDILVDYPNKQARPLIYRVAKDEGFRL